VNRLDTRLLKLKDAVGAAGVRHFAAEELVRHDHPDWPHDRLYPPPARLHDHIIPTLQLADRIRKKWGGPVRVVSGYRAPSYNDFHVEGSPQSQHMDFRALDLQPYDGDIEGFIDVARREVARARVKRDDGVGFGLYRTFIHIDTGHYTRDRGWNRRRGGGTRD